MPSSSKEPSISVIIPTYNRAKFIAKSVQSVLDQEGAEVEVIIIDDGSTDDTERVLAPFLDRITYRRIDNSGRPAVPRNVALTLAGGDLIAFQDSDDLWLPGKLQKQLSQFEDPAVVLSYTNAEVMTVEGERTGQLVVPTEKLKEGRVFPELLETNFISTSTVMVRREALERAGGFNESPKLRGVEDYELWLQLARLGEVSLVPEPLVLYRKHEANISADNESAPLRRILAVLKTTLRSSLTPNERAQVKHRISELYRYLIEEPKTSELERLIAKFQRQYYLRGL